jgi:hypothetical protein
VGLLARLDAVRILPPANIHAYSAWWPSQWSKTWRVAVPLYDATGAMVSIQARAVVPLTGGDPKTRNPLGCSVGGTFFASADGLALLRGVYAGSGLTIVEGLTDTLAAAQLVERLAPEMRPAILGIVAGSAKALANIRVLTRSIRLNVLTDSDKPGDRYFEEIRQALPYLAIRQSKFDGEARI